MPSPAPRFSACLLAAWLLAATAPAMAQDEGIERYPASHFAADAPANAYDMLLRLPGFGIVDADVDVRGYAGALGNVLVDGARPASKREDSASLLRRIPADSVERIELIRAGHAGIDMGGHAVLANVVRRKVASSELATEAGLALSGDGWAAPSAELEYGRHWGERQLELSLSLAPEYDDDSGDGRITSTFANGDAAELSDTQARVDARVLAGSASLRQPLAQGQLSAHAALRQERMQEDTRVQQLAPGSSLETGSETEDFRESELVLRHVRSLAGNSLLELAASQRSGWLDTRARSDEDGEIERFDQRNRSSERILRASLAHEPWPRLSLGWALEATGNRLDGESRLLEDGVPIDLPGSDVGIRERRLEASMQARWRREGDWRLEAGLRVEHSRLQQSGDSPMQRRFTYLKPRLVANWEPGEHNQWRLALSREVGQLDFEEFVASAALDTGVVSAGNAGLEPDKTLRLALGWERSLWTDAALVLTWTHDRISDVVDRVPVQSGDELFDAPGNIGDGRRDQLALELGGSLAPLGWPSLHASATVLWSRSRVTDPSTGLRRPISGDKPVSGELSLEQSLPDHRFKWGVSLALAERETEYRYDEVGTEYEPRSWQLFAERTLGEGWRLRAELSDAGGREFSERRLQYDGQRSQVPLAEEEWRRHRAAGTFMLSLRRSTGA